MSEDAPTPNEMLMQLAIQELPVIIELVRQVFIKHNPEAPPPTDADVMAVFNQAYAQSLAVDEQWQAAHPVLPLGEAPAK
jgi:hypothetical protein